MSSKIRKNKNIGTNKDREDKTDESGKLVNLSGRYTTEEVEYMRRNAGKISIEEIATQLRKKPETIRKYLKNKFGFVEEATAVVGGVADERFDIKKSPMWIDLKNQFSENELNTFLYHWNNIIVQFKNDVLATERMQLIEFCRLEILINRSMAKLKEVDIVQKEARKEIDDLKEKSDKDEEDMKRIASLEMIIANMIQSHQKITFEYKELINKKSDIIKEIKGSRMQRIQRLEDSKKSIISWMTSILEDPLLRTKLGLEMKKMALSTHMELARLSQYHTYADGKVEQSILSADTLLDDNL